VFVIIFYCFKNKAENPGVADQLNYFTPSALPLFFGVAVFDFEGNNTILNLHSAMKAPKNVHRALNIILVFYVLLIASFSTIAYYCYGEALDDMVILNLPHDNLTSTLQIVYSIGLLGSYPIQMMPVFQIIEKTRTFRKLKLAGKYKIYVWRTQCVSLTSIIAMSVPRFGLFINLVGSVACTALAFVFPVLIYNKTFEKEISR